MRWWLAIAASAGCLGRPTPHGLGDADNRPDSPIDTSPSCAIWQGPTAIPLAFLPPTDYATSPWLSDDRTDLWFTQLFNGQPLTGVIVEVANVTDVTQRFGSPMDTQSFDNVFIAGNGTVWLDQQDRSGIGTRYIEEQPPHSPIGGHIELTDLKQITFTGDGANFYASRRSAPNLLFGALANDQLMMVSSLVDPPTIAFQSASVSRDGSALYMTGTVLTTRQLYVATPNATHTGYDSVDLVAGFQMSDHNYFDPNISTDGATLVFASDFEGAPRIYYATRPSGCAH